MTSLTLLTSTTITTRQITCICALLLTQLCFTAQAYADYTSASLGQYQAAILQNHTQNATAATQKPSNEVIPSITFPDNKTPSNTFPDNSTPNDPPQSNSHHDNAALNSDADFEELDQRPILALQRLDSLKNLGHNTSFHAPFVQDLPNPYGVRSLFVSAPALPILDIQLTFNAGSARDPEIGEGLYGLANMTARLMMEGTSKHSAQEIAKQLEKLGAKLSVQAYRDMFIVKLRVMSAPAQRQAAIDLMLELIQDATFKQSYILNSQQRSQVGQRQAIESPSQTMSVQFYRALYGTHPYAEPTLGTQAAIRKMTTADLNQFRQRFLVAQNMNIAMTGDLEPAEASQITKYIIQQLPQGVKAQKLPLAHAQQQLNIHFIPFQAQQAHVLMGQLSVPRNHPDRIALELANQVFGGRGLNAILMQELRVKRGLSYAAYSHLTTMQSQGVFSLSFATSQDQLYPSILLSYQLLQDFIQAPISKPAIEETKEGMLRAFPMSFSSNANINAQLASIGFYGLDANYLSLYQKQLHQLTTQQVQAAVRRHLNLDQLSLVVYAENLDIEQLKAELNIIHTQKKH